MELSVDKIDQLAECQLTYEELLMLRMKANMSVADIAAAMGFSRQWVSRLLKEAMRKVEAQKNI